MIERPIRSRGRRLQLSSSRIRAQSLSSRDTTTTTDSAEEFIEPSPSSFSRSRGRGRSRSSTPAATAVSSSTATVTGTAPIASATERVYRAVQHGLSLLNSTAPLPTELGTRFPFLNQGGRRQKRRKISKWKTIPCCLSKPDISRVPTKSAMDDLCRDGMGTLWFSRDEEPLELDLLSSTELHYLVVSLYPMLKNTSYEFCRAGGPGHQVIVPLSIDDPTRIPSNDQPFLPYFISGDDTYNLFYFQSSIVIYLDPLELGIPLLTTDPLDHHAIPLKNPLVSQPIVLLNLGLQ